MKVEIPSDQYIDGLKILKKKIVEGKVEGVADPEIAEKILLRGSVTYDDAVAQCKMFDIRDIKGTFGSLKYDFQTGMVTAFSIVGLTFFL